jgi:HEPN domain-containing protein
MAREEAAQWLRRARSNLQLGKAGRTDGVMLEDLCFEIQQAAEKSLKAVLINADAQVPRTHALGLLVQKIEAVVEVPEEVQRVVELADYAVQTRYPGDYPAVTNEEYDDAVAIAEAVFDWATRVVGLQE